MSDKETVSVGLTFEELSLLDGKCSDRVQGEVNYAKRCIGMTKEFPDLTEAEIAFIAKAVRAAIDDKKLVIVYRPINNCHICGKAAGYAIYSRRSRYHHKGDINYDKPLTISGVDLKDDCIRIEGYTTVGGCINCFDKLKPYAAKALDGIKAEVPEKLTGKPSKWLRVKTMECSECGWTGLETQMGMLPAIMNGHYHGQCPHCMAKNMAFGRTKIKRVGYMVVENDKK